MISGVASNFSYNTSTTSASTNRVSTTKASESKNEAVQSSQSAKTDTVEISPQAKAAASVGSKTSSQDTETKQSNANTASVTTSASTGASSSTAAPVLSSLTEQAMNILVSKGTITSSQEKNELARRSAEQEVTQATSKTPSHAIKSYMQQKQSTHSTLTSGSLLNYVA